MTHRGWQGAIRIVLFNRRWYAAGAPAVACAIAVSIAASPPWRGVLLAAACPALFWLVASVLVSHYVYDRSLLYGFEWLPACLPSPPRRWINLHAGLDETGGALLLPGERRTLDIFDPREMTEPSIRRARRLDGARSEPANWRALPIDDASCDAVCLIFAAHELRRHEARVRLFRESARILRHSGRVVVAEHVRDWANFAAFGPGFLHFFPEREWRSAAAQAGLTVCGHSTLTPFVHIFVLRRADDPHPSTDCGSAAALAGRRA